MHLSETSRNSLPPATCQRPKDLLALTTPLSPRLKKQSSVVCTVSFFQLFSNLEIKSYFRSGGLFIKKEAFVLMVYIQVCYLNLTIYCFLIRV